MKALAINDQATLFSGTRTARHPQSTVAVAAAASYTQFAKNAFNRAPGHAPNA